MKSSEASYQNSKKVPFISKSIVLAVLLLIATLFLFDKSPSNDYVGWATFILFWTVKSGFDFFEDRKNGRKVSAIINLTLIAIGFGILLWQMISFLSF